MSDPSFHIESPRLYLSYFLPENTTHCDFLVELYNTPEFIASIGGRPTPITTREAAHERLAGSFREEHARNGYGRYLVSLKPTMQNTDVDSAPSFSGKLEENVPIGMISLMRGSGPNSYTAPDLGFVIHPKYTRNGYAKEASAAVLQHVKNNLDVNDVLGLFDPTNEASKGVFRSLGFEDRGLRTLKVFGGVEGAVWVKPEMAQDLSVYGL